MPSTGDLINRPYITTFFRGYAKKNSVPSFLINRVAHATRRLVILCERGRAYRCRRAAVFSVVKIVWCDCFAPTRNFNCPTNVN